MQGAEGQEGLLACCVCTLQFCVALFYRYKQHKCIEPVNVTLVCLFSKDLGKPLIQVYRSVTTKYDATLKEMSPTEKEASFSVMLYLWLAFLEEPPLKDTAAVVEHKKQLEREVTEWRSSLKEAERLDEKSTLMLMLGQHVKMFRLSTCHLASQMRWEVIAVDHAAPVAQLFMKHLCVECKGR
eukprot:TRINITY_DN67724_c0_g1_i1.p1 TRINITY_DN67724_c0_g1~~TRINITY_DN67724_c0_g1_i1.p1  ORF type:complete len:183 (+),score=23.71 TRINITY_DN67724_c0_g1_i1:131-679(+)